jgi:ArsR family transcriptional regulator
MENDLKKYEEISEILKALSHPVRLCIVNGLLEKGKCNVSHMQTCLEIPQSTISQHLQKLRSAGVIDGNRNGNEINYSVSNPIVIKLLESIF